MAKKNSDDVAAEALGKGQSKEEKRRIAQAWSARKRDERADEVLKQKKFAHGEWPTDKQIEDVCRRISVGQSLQSICSKQSMPALDTLLAWIHPDMEGMPPEGVAQLNRFMQKYSIAVKRRLELEIYDIVDIADSATGKDDAPAVKLKVEARQWALERQRPQEFAKPSRNLTPNDADPEKAASALEDALEIIAKRRATRGQRDASDALCTARPALDASQDGTTLDVQAFTKSESLEPATFINCEGSDAQVSE